MSSIFCLLARLFQFCCLMFDNSRIVVEILSILHCLWDCHFLKLSHLTYSFFKLIPLFYQQCLFLFLLLLSWHYLLLCFVCGLSSNQWRLLHSFFWFRKTPSSIHTRNRDVLCNRLRHMLGIILRPRSPPLILWNLLWLLLRLLSYALWWLTKCWRFFSSKATRKSFRRQRLFRLTSLQKAKEVP